MTDTELLGYYKEIVTAQNEAIAALSELVKTLNTELMHR